MAGCEPSGYRNDIRCRHRVRIGDSCICSITTIGKATHVKKQIKFSDKMDDVLDLTNIHFLEPR